MNENDLISYIRDNFTKPPHLKNWMDDDCEIIDVGMDNELILVSVDTCSEGIDFTEDTPDFCIGYSSTSHSLSDIAACGGQSLGILVSIQLPKKYEERVKGIYEGIKECLKNNNTFLLGGDTNSTGEFSISVVAVGKVHKDKVLRRKTAKIGDLVGVTGVLDTLNKEFHKYKETGTCDFRKGLINNPCLVEGKILADIGASSCIDLPDGLIKTLNDNMGEYGYLIFDEKIPVSAEKEKYKAASNPSGDIELMFTISKDKKELLEKEFLAKGLKVFWIGEIISEKGVYIEIEGEKKHIKDKGFVHEFGKQLV